MKIKIYSPHRRPGIGDYTNALYRELINLNIDAGIIPNNNPLTLNPFYFIKAALNSKCNILHVQFNTDLFGKLWKINGLYIYLYYLLAKLAGPAIITTVHDVPDISEYRLLSRIYLKFLHLPVFMLSRYIIVHTQEAKQLLSEYGLSRSKIRIIPIGIDTNVSIINPADCKKRLGLNGKTVLFMWGFIRASKRYEDIINILPSLDEDIVFLIAGPVRPWCQKYVSYLKELTNKLCLEKRIIFDTRMVPNEEIPVYFGASDIILFPYADITQSAALSQAFAYLKPVLASNIPSFNAIKKKWNCIEIYQLRNKSELISKIKLLLTNKPSRKSLIRNTKRLLDATNWRQIAKQTCSIYNEACESLLASFSTYENKLICPVYRHNQPNKPADGP